ncbi:Rieske 2Fe-2S domain-containing protein [Glutamicibacter sp.]|uniref:Rieske (2Fe-2S) protein n=1 Tax=Glutamicibacter sp. TaxID=1931995 RepID=UPI0028BF55D9|nr:Rieske 2Fe-2S domain-containing protein [Glutamicibacter sp.]
MTSHDGMRTLGPASEISEGYVVPYYLEDVKHRVSVARVDGRLYAFDDLCPQGVSPLSAGLLEGYELLCQSHGCRFDVRTGEVLSGPSVQRLPVHGVQEEESQVKLRLNHKI